MTKNATKRKPLVEDKPAPGTEEDKAIGEQVSSKGSCDRRVDYSRHKLITEKHRNRAKKGKAMLQEYVLHGDD